MGTALLFMRGATADINIRGRHTHMASDANGCSASHRRTASRWARMEAGSTLVASLVIALVIVAGHLGPCSADPADA